MSKNQIESNFNDPGTYQTGVAEHPGRKSSVLIAVLLMLAIFLGGLASALGLINIRLLQQLRKTGSTLPVDVYTQSSGNSGADKTPDPDLPEPELPQKVSACLQLRMPPDRTSALGNELSNAEIYAVNESAMVQLQCTSELGTRTGLGVVMHTGGYILTNAHLVDTAGSIYAQLADGQVYRAALVGTDALTDLAVLYIRADALTAAAFGTSSLLQEDDTILSTQSTPGNLARGTLTNARRAVRIGSHSLRLLQTTVSACDGPVFNRYGQVVGMNSSTVPGFFDLYLQADTGYAIPSATIKEVADQLMQHGFVAGRPTLGVQTQAISKVYQQYWDLPGGLRLLKVSPQAAAQGLQTDDILLALGGQRLTENADLHRILFSGAIGDTLTAVVFRNGESLTLSLTIFDTAA